jgi:nitrogen fixation protein FixH
MNDANSNDGEKPMRLRQVSIEDGGEATGRPLTGWKVLGILVAFFGTVAAVNGVMVYSALTTFRGEVTPHAYESGLAYDKEITRAHEQQARGWKVDQSLQRLASGETLARLSVADKAGAPVAGAAATLTLEAPADLKNDVALTLSETDPGVYEGRAMVAPGLRDVVVSITRDGSELFRSRSRLRIE